ncbi:MAG: DEAD/DEAH box helicase [Alphaproteobacteria bacterium]|nr:DEAD/DEAH box helicase [Alphaproteobacteria bacterium]
MTSFESMGLEARLLRALQQEGYATPTPIQAQAIPHVLEGRDILGIAQTGTGKTASFALPILQRLALNPRTPEPKTARALILSPTRELAAQIADSFRAYSRYMNVSITTIFGGVSEHPQKQNMARGIDVLVATPGRLRDLVAQRAVELSKTEIFVLDEADRMLDMGFIADIRRIVKFLGPDRQNLFFSATMPEEIGRLAGELLHNPVRVSVTPPATTVERIAQRVIHVSNGDKRALLINLLRTDTAMARTLVFTRTKHGADKVVRALAAAGINASAIHGNKSQSQRVNALNNFRSGRAPVLIATDIAARGIDIDGISHVINFDLPHVPESYVHRIGRTARAGADGIAIAFCDREERPLLRDIEKVTRQQIPASEWRAPAGEAGTTPAPVQTHEQKQEGRRQRDFEDRPRPPQASRHPRPHRKGNNPRHDILAHMAAQGPQPEVSVEPRSPDGQFRAPKPAQRQGKPHGARPFGGDRPRNGEQRPDRREAPRGDHRNEQRTDRPAGNRDAQGADQRGERAFTPRGDRPFHKRGDRPQNASRDGQPGDRPFHKGGDAPRNNGGGKPGRPFQSRGDRPQGAARDGQGRPGKFGKRPTARAY